MKKKQKMVEPIDIIAKNKQIEKEKKEYGLHVRNAFNLVSKGTIGEFVAYNKSRKNAKYKISGRDVTRIINDDFTPFMSLKKVKYIYEVCKEFFQNTPVVTNVSKEVAEKISGEQGQPNIIFID